ncbi:MAG: hypothetical protein AAGC55_21430, partial [Myxococcota bacterium]
MSSLTIQDEFAGRARELIGELLAADGLVGHVVATLAGVFEQIERDVFEVVRSRYINLADPETEFPFDLIRIASLFGLGAEPGMPTEVFRERLRLFVQAYLQGAGTPQSMLTMAAAEIGVLLSGPPHRRDTIWIQPVRRPGQPPDVIRLEENPIYRVERQPVLAKTGTRWTIDNPGSTGDALIYPQVTIEALTNDVHGPSILLEDIGLAWLSPTVVLNRGDQLVLRIGDSGMFQATVHSYDGVHNVTDEV